MTLFRAFWYNDYGIADKYVDYWAYTANRLSSNPYVAGFDPFNEPFPAWKGIWSLLKTIMPFSGNMDKHELAPLYERLFDKYQAADPESIMWFEPSQFPDELPGIVLPLGFDTPPGGDKGSANHALNDHTYCCQRNPEICAASGEPKPGSEKECYDWHH